jgi:DMSO/TMAO reductase YedYZ molybdopterin-dependent catalytic subunit
MLITRGFKGRGKPQIQNADRLPPGQHLTTDFPVLTAGPTQHMPVDQWSFSLEKEGRSLATWSWADFGALPQTESMVDIHCVTRWTKFDTRWRGVSFDDLLRAAGLEQPPTLFVMAHCDGGYTTNLPIADLIDGKAMVATHFDGMPLPAVHGGPARLLVPHLYFWKSAKWVRSIRFIGADQPGFWESFGYHIYGDPFREQRYAGDV